MYFTATQCCGFQEISSLSNHQTPEQAMAAFCASHFGSIRKKNPNGKDDRSYGDGPHTLYTFYVFTAAIYGPKKRDNVFSNRGLYGAKFAEFIKEQKLGTVTTIPAKVNKAFHPDHKVQVWIWHPSREPLTRWWQGFSTAKQAEEAAKKAEIAAALATACPPPA